MRRTLLCFAFVAAVAACGPGLTAQGPGPLGPIDVGPPPANYTTTDPTPTGTCSTGQWWNAGDEESENMHPGVDCIACHADRGEGPRYTVAGTAFQNIDDEDDCRGIDNVDIEIYGSDGTLAFTVSANSVGNFTSRAALAAIAPYTAKVIYEGRTAEMTTPQTDGACNRCHTAEGVDGAPGRILVP